MSVEILIGYRNGSEVCKVENPTLEQVKCLASEITYVNFKSGYSFISGTVSQALQYLSTGECLPSYLFANRSKLECYYAFRNEGLIFNNSLFFAFVHLEDGNEPGEGVPLALKPVVTFNGKYSAFEKEIPKTLWDKLLEDKSTFFEVAKWLGERGQKEIAESCENLIQSGEPLNHDKDNDFYPRQQKTEIGLWTRDKNRQIFTMEDLLEVAEKERKKYGKVFDFQLVSKDFDFPMCFDDAAQYLSTGECLQTHKVKNYWSYQNPFRLKDKVWIRLNKKALLVYCDGANPPGENVPFVPVWKAYLTHQEVQCEKTIPNELAMKFIKDDSALGEIVAYLDFEPLNEAYKEYLNK